MIEGSIFTNGIYTSIALSLVLALAWARAVRSMRPAILLVIALCLLAPFLGRTALSPSTVVTASIDVMHEDSALGLVHRITAPAAWPSRLMVGAGHGLKGTVATNRLLVGLTFAALTVILRGLVGSWMVSLWLVVMVMVGGLSRITASSETWSPVIWFATVLGAMGLATARKRSLPLALRLLAVAHMALLGLWLGPRVEMGIIWGLALSASMWSVTFGPDSAQSRALAALVRRPLRAPIGAWIVVLGLMVAQGLWRSELLGGLQQLGRQLMGASPSYLHLQVVSALLPTDVSFLLLPRTLSLAAPVALVILTLAGAWHIARRSQQWLWLLVATASVYKIYHSVGHGHRYESLRYIANLLPVLIVIGALGWQELSPRVMPLLRSRRRRGAALFVLGALSLIDGRYGMNDSPWGPWPLTATLDGGYQRSGRFMLSATERWPDCIVVTRSATRFDFESRVVAETLAVWGHRWPADAVDGDYAALPAALGRLKPVPQCALMVDSLDCGLDGAGDCAAGGVGAPLTSFEAPTKPYRHPHFGVQTSANMTHTVRLLAPKWQPASWRHRPPPTQ
ncbi:MAG: hypothetical protein KC502_22230 [Myxococcales bacterium]|nr:hypothetical protein [Myxococcales bacterium]